MKSQNITATDGRLDNLLYTKINQVIDSRDIETIIDKKVRDSKIATGTVVKFYPYKDKVMVRLTNTSTNVICKILHRMMGSLIDYYTPEGDLDYCDVLKEPCIFPRERLYGLVADVNDESNEQLFLGFYIKDDVVDSNPAKQGYYKISNIGATNHWGVSIGLGEINISSSDGVLFKEGETASDDTVITYANSDDVPSNDDVYTRDELYTRDDLYTRDEVDELISKAIADLITDYGLTSEESD